MSISPPTTPTVGLPLRTVHRNPTQPRTHFDQIALDELATNMSQFGLLQPIIVRPMPCDCEDLEHDTHYQIIAGERRWRAAQQLEWDAIDARILVNMTDENSYILSISENIARKDMLPSEVAHAYGELIRLGYTTAQVAQLVGRTAHYVELLLEILTYSPELAEANDTGEVGSLTCWYMGRCSHEAQREILRKLKRGDFANQQAVQRFANAVRQLEEHPELQVSEQPEELAKRSEFADIWNRIERTTRAFGPLLRMAPHEIGDMLVRDAQYYIDELSRMERDIRRAQSLLQAAAGAAEVEQALGQGFPTARRGERAQLPLMD